MSTAYAEGIILKHQHLREADRLLTVYTREFGLVKVIAKGVRKITSKLAGSLEPFAVVQLWLVGGRQFETVANAEIIENFGRLKADVHALAAASYVSEMVDRTVPARHRESRIYDLIREVFGYLDRGAALNSSAVVLWYFTWRCLGYLGYQPELYTCLICREKITEQKNYFSFQKGGIVCERCGHTLAPLLPLSSTVVKVLRLVNGTPAVPLGRVVVRPPLAAEVNELTRKYINFSHEQDLSIAAFLSGY